MVLMMIDMQEVRGSRHPHPLLCVLILAYSVDGLPFSQKSDAAEPRCTNKSINKSIKALLGSYSSSWDRSLVAITMAGSNISIVNPPYNKTMPVADFMVSFCINLIAAMIIGFDNDEREMDRMTRSGRLKMIKCSCLQLKCDQLTGTMSVAEDPGQSILRQGGDASELPRLRCNSDSRRRPS